MHLYRECQMTALCEECQQVVPVPQLGAHLMGECMNSSYYKKCSRCKEPVHQRLYRAHTEQKSCLAAKPMSAHNRCPLCHEDVEPGAAGWKEHLVVRGCRAGR